MSVLRALLRPLARWRDRQTIDDPGVVELPVVSGRILVTGAAGEVATLIRPHLRAVCGMLRLSDIRPITPEVSGEEVVVADLRDGDAVARAVAGVDGIVHLGGIAKEGPWDALLSTNVHGVVNLLEAAREHGVRRVVLASTMHVLGFYDRGERVSVTSPPRPDSRYAITKLFAENLGAYYAHRFGLQITCLRIGHVTARREAAEPASWIACEDLVALIRLGLAHPDVRFEVVHAVAPYDGDDIGQEEVWRRFGFRSRHHGGSYASALRHASRHFHDDRLAVRWRGGIFASSRGEMV